MPDIEKVRGHLRGIQHRMLDPEPLDDVDRTDIHLRMALTLTLLTIMEAEIKRLTRKMTRDEAVAILNGENHLGGEWSKCNSGIVRLGGGDYRTLPEAVFIAQGLIREKEAARA